MQEVGGKTYEKSMEYVQEFIKILCEAEQMKDYERVRIYLDEDYNSPEHFTVITTLKHLSAPLYKCVTDSSYFCRLLATCTSYQSR